MQYVVVKAVFHGRCIWSDVGNDTTWFKEPEVPFLNKMMRVSYIKGMSIDQNAIDRPPPVIGSVTDNSLEDAGNKSYSAGTQQPNTCTRVCAHNGTDTRLCVVFML